jgi:hypothetical protein
LVAHLDDKLVVKKDLVVSALPESIKFRVPDPELDRELGTYNGGN